MVVLQLLLCLALVCVQGAVVGPEARTGTTSAERGQQTAVSAGVLDSVLRGTGKSRQSRCVRCYEDRYYGSSGDRYGSAGDRYGSSGDRYGGYSSRSGEEPRSSWYYSYDRYDDRGAGGRGGDYDRYSSRDDRYSSRPYESRYEGRYEGRGYDDYNYRRGSTYDRGSSYGYSGYDRDRYAGYGDRYSDNSRDRYYDRSRSGSSYDRYDPYDRYYSRGQSGFDNSGRGYYFAGNDDDSRGQTHSLYDRAPASPCGQQVSNCPYGDRGTKVSSNAIGSDGYRGGHTSVMNQGSWTYLGEQDKQGSRGGGSSVGTSSSSGNSNSGSSGTAGGAGAGGGGGGSGRDREQDAQSSSYGGRPRPLGGSYLFDRDSNAVPEGPSEATNSNGVGNGVGSNQMPAAAAQTAANPNESQDEVKDKAVQ